MYSRLILLLIALSLTITATESKEVKVNVRRLRNLQANAKTVCVVVDDDTASRLKVGSGKSINITLMRLERQDGCQTYTKTPAYRGNFVAVLSNVCPLTTMVEKAKEAGASGLVVIANMSVYPLSLGSGSPAIPVILISDNLYIEGVVQNKTKVRYFKLQLLPRLDTGRGFAPTIAFFFITLVCLISGMWMSVHGKVDVNHKLMLGSPKPRPSGYQALQSEASGAKDCSLCTSVAGVLCLLIFSTTSLLLLYFFYDIFVWLIIVMICICFTISFKSLIMEAVVRVCESWNDRCIRPIRRQVVKCFFGDSLDWRGVLLLPLCAIPAIIWFIYRKQTFTVWIIQDICGVAGCIYIMKVVRFGSLKLITIFVSLFFLYDIFMVYITPLLMKKAPPSASSILGPSMWHNVSTRRVKRSTNGMSVMESVATGSAGTSGEKLPILFMLPRFNIDGSYSLVMDLATTGPCYHPTMTLLGFGDVIVPGIIIAYAFWCDVRLREETPDRKLSYLYSILTLIGYQVGLGLVYVLLYVMNSGQPALLMLIPCTMIPFAGVAALRHELSRVWNGFPPPSSLIALSTEHEAGAGPEEPLDAPHRTSSLDDGDTDKGL